MDRGKGKGKKQSVIVNLQDPGNVDEETLPIYRRRGRPQKSINDGTEEEKVAEKVEVEDVKINTASIDISTEAVTENGRKRKSPFVSGMKIELTEESIQVKTSADDSTKSAGFRKIGSRRKGKPRRAAEASVNVNEK